MASASRLETCGNPTQKARRLRFATGKWPTKQESTLRSASTLQLVAICRGSEGEPRLPSAEVHDYISSLAAGMYDIPKAAVATEADAESLAKG